MSWSFYEQAKRERLENPKHGPLGLGHPDDKRVRKVERESVIAELMRERAKAEHCVEEFAGFTNCLSAHPFSFVFNCRKESTVYQNCMNNKLKEKEFEQLCTNEYLEKRSEYRKTGVAQKILGAHTKPNSTHF